MPQIGPDVPPIREVMTTAIFFRKVADVGAVVGIPIVQDDLEAAGQRVPEVPVADDGIEVTEFLLVVHRGLGDGADDDIRHRRGWCSSGLLHEQV